MDNNESAVGQASQEYFGIYDSIPYKDLAFLNEDEKRQMVAVASRRIVRLYHIDWWRILTAKPNRQSRRQVRPKNRDIKDFPSSVREMQNFLDGDEDLTNEGGIRIADERDEAWQRKGCQTKGKPVGVCFVVL